MSLNDFANSRPRATSHQDALRGSLAISKSSSVIRSSFMGDRSNIRNSMRASTLRTVAKDSALRSSAVRGIERSMNQSIMVEGELEAKTQLDNDDFKYSEEGLTSREAEHLLSTYGRNELPDNSTPRWKIFVNLLIQPMALMLWIASIVEAIVENWSDFTILLSILFLNAGLGYYESTKAGDAVAALKASLKPLATVKRDGQWITLDASFLVPGDLVKLAAGSAVPADCRLNEGTIEVDQSALTGESIAVKMVFGDKLNHPKMGTNVVKGESDGTVEFTGAKTLMGQTASLLEGGSEKSNMDKILITVTLVLVVLSLVLSAIVFGFGLWRGQQLNDDLTFTVVLIVASIPLAIEIVCTTTLALGSKQLSKEGAIVSRLSSIEDLAGMNMLCSDKTGTLTTNKMEIQSETPVFMTGENQRSILQAAAMAAKWKEPPRDALDTLVLGAADLSSLSVVTQLEFIPFDPVTKRTEATVQISGYTFKVTKGAPHVLINLCDESQKDKQNMLGVQHKLAGRGVRALAVAKTNEEGKWKMMGMLTFLDPPRPDSKKTIDEAREYGVPVKMITGDHLLIAQETARVLGLQGSIEGPDDLPLLGENNSIPANLVSDFGARIEGAGGFAQVFPQHKYLIVACLRQMTYKVGMTGDGVNDAPALKQADVGIAVSGATDAARAAADIILTRPGLYTIVNGIVIAREIFQRINNFISYRIAASLQLLVFFFFSVLVLRPEAYQPPGKDWPEFFKMPVLLLMLITLLNDGTLISIGYDYVTASPQPSQWKLVELFFTSSVLGLVSCVSSVLLLQWALDSWSDNSFFRQIGLNPLNYGEIIMMMYLKISVSDFLTLFSSRTGNDFFWSTKPAPILMIAAGFSLTLSTLIATFWPDGKLDGEEITGLKSTPILVAAVWIYSLGVWLVQDLAKVLAYKLSEKFSSRRKDDSDF